MSVVLLYKLFVYRLFGLKGRSNRKEYIIRFSTMFILYGITIFKSSYTNHSNSWVIFVFDSFFVIIFVMYIIQMFFLNHRRLHDLNASGWWQLITFIPLGQILMIGFIFFKGTDGANRYGEPPKY